MFDDPGFLSCFERRLNASSHMLQQGHDPTALCPMTYDQVMCWPFAEPNTTVVVPCMRELNGIYYDQKDNVTRFCQADGSWEPQSNYSACKALASSFDTALATSSMRDVTTQENLATLHLLGNTLSVAALAIGLFIFIRFKDLRCVRNTIHIHLMVTYLLLDLCWLLAAFSQMVIFNAGGPAFCGLVLVFHFFQLANFSWMLVEGLYLYLSVVKTFSVEKLKLRLYLLLGWALPLPIAVAWATVRVAFSSEKESSQGFSLSCPWIEESTLDWIHRVPVFFVLTVNTGFLVHVMVVLIKKLRANASMDSIQQSKRALKSLLVLMPLLGSPHVFLMVAPSHGTFAIIIAYVRAIVLSSQGLIVTIFYCFLNSEVQESINNHMERWKSTRDVPPGSCPYSYQEPVTRNQVLTCESPGKTHESVPLHTFTEVTSSSGRITENVSDVKDYGETTMAVFPPAIPRMMHYQSRSSSRKNSTSSVHQGKVYFTEAPACKKGPVASSSSPTPEMAKKQQSSTTNSQDIIQPLKEVFAIC